MSRNVIPDQTVESLPSDFSLQVDPGKVCDQLRWRHLFGQVRHNCEPGCKMQHEQMLLLPFYTLSDEFVQFSPDAVEDRSSWPTCWYSMGWRTYADPDQSTSCLLRERLLSGTFCLLRSLNDAVWVVPSSIFHISGGIRLKYNLCDRTQTWFQNFCLIHLFNNWRQQIYILLISMVTSTSAVIDHWPVKQTILLLWAVL